MTALRLICILAACILLCGLCGCGSQAVPPAPVILSVPEPDPDDPADIRSHALLDEMETIRSAVTEEDPGLFSFEDSGDGLTLTAYSGSASRIRVPATIEDKPVRGLACGVFSGLSDLTVLILPGTLTDLEERCLEGCDSLVYLELSALPGDSLSGLFGKAGWEYNHSAIPESLSYICYAGVRVPDRAFAECLHIEALILPDTVESIGTSSFRTCRSLKEIRLPDGLKEIRTCAFLDCGSLTGLSLPDSLERIEDGILTGCVSLAWLDLPFLGSTPDDTAHAFLARQFGAATPEFCEAVPLSLHQVRLTKVSRIEPMAFLHCAGLRHTVLPDGLTVIGDLAFSECSHLKSVTLSRDLETIGKSAFSGCIRLCEILFPDSLKRIDIQAFEKCLSLQKIGLPSRLESVGNSAFAYCISLNDVTLSGSPVLGDRVFFQTPYAQRRTES